MGVGIVDGLMDGFEQDGFAVFLVFCHRGVLWLPEFVSALALEVLFRFFF